VRTALAGTLTITTGIAVAAAARPATPGPASKPLTPRHQPAAATGPAATGPAPLVLTASDRQDCPAAATACVDLTRHISWLQADGTISFGPVRMEPGQPGTAHATPRGTFHVSWKAGPHYLSTIYREQMPWATFFAAGGIAFHGGSLTQWSHGCVHLTVANAHRYQENLPVGAEVVVF
jgi:lipoprotein-anchoring transpeptidase ErfK/SrfK